MPEYDQFEKWLAQENLDNLQSLSNEEWLYDLLHDTIKGSPADSSLAVQQRETCARDLLRAAFSAGAASGRAETIRNLLANKKKNKK